MGDQSPIYLDANTTVLPSRAACAAVSKIMATFPANPSSAHYAGQRARAELESAREAVCMLVHGIDPDDVVFTSGGTEGNNTVINGFQSVSNAGVTITSSAEHPSVYEPARVAGRLVEVPVSQTGLLHPETLAREIPMEGPFPLVAFHWVNGETGVLQDAPTLASAVKKVREDAIILVDAAQAVGRVPIEFSGIDALTFSGHKLHGPAGTGVLVLVDSARDWVRPLLRGGGQEGGMRSGTHNVAGVAGLGAAIRERALDFDMAGAAMAAMRDTFEDAVLSGIRGAVVNGAGAPRVPNTTNIRFPNVDGAMLQAALDHQGVACSVGSACSSARPEPSATLLAMGLSEQEAWASVRFSFSVMNTMEEAERAARLVVETARRLT